MKSLREFLLEQMFPELGYVEGYKHENPNVHNHSVYISFHGKRHLSINFDVERTDERPMHHSSLADKIHVLRYVQKRVSDFVREKKPLSLYFVGDTDEKHYVWGEFAKNLAKEHKGEYEENRMGTHWIRFPRHADE